MGPGASYRRVVDAAILVCLLTAPWWLYNLLFADFDTPQYFSGENSPLVLGAILGIAALNLASMHLVTRREPAIGPLMIVGYFLKLAAIGTYLYMAMMVYEGAADMLAYFHQGETLSLRYELTGQLPYLSPIWGSNSVHVLTAYIMMVCGPAMSLIMVIYACFGFWGQYFFYRAFCLAYPEGERYRAILFIFLFPSIIYWTSAIGKDGLMALGLGLVCYGLAMVTVRSTFRGMLPLVIGVIITLVVRPHIAGLVGVALASTALLGKNLRGVSGVIAKVIGIPLLLLASYYLVGQAKAFVDVEDVAQGAHVLNFTATHNRYGGSAFGGTSLPVRVAYAPFLLFRPFPWEIHNVQALIASAEGMFLLLMFWKRRRQIGHLFLHFRDKPFTFFVLLCIVELSAVLAGAISNFGLLARERVMMMPMAVMLLCLPLQAATPPRTPARVSPVG